LLKKKKKNFLKMSKIEVAAAAKQRYKDRLVACYLCDKAGKKCDGRRPCSNCIDYEVPQMCFGLELVAMQQRREQMARENPHLYEQQQREQREKLQSQKQSQKREQKQRQLEWDRKHRQQKQQRTPSSLSTTNASGNVNRSSNSSTSTSSSSSSRPIDMRQSYKRERDGDNWSSSSSSSSFASDDVGNASNLESVFDGMAASPTALVPLDTSGPRQFGALPASQSDINQTLWQELQRMKTQLRVMDEEMLALKLRNLSLENMVRARITDESASQGAPTAETPAGAIDGLLVDDDDDDGTPTATSTMTSSAASAQTPALGELPSIVYDLRQTPVTAIRANSAFCSLLGYDEGEVINQPWQRFVHKDYWEAARNFLAQAAHAKRGRIEIDLVYLSKRGTPVAARDVHNIIADSRGVPIIDQVTVCPNLPKPTATAVTEYTGPPSLFSALPNKPAAVGLVSPASSRRNSGTTHRRDLPFLSSSSGNEFLDITSSIGSPSMLDDDVGVISVATDDDDGDDSDSIIQGGSHGVSSTETFDDTDSLPFEFLEASPVHPDVDAVDDNPFSRNLSTSSQWLLQ
jgi:PAS domain S-box-containing protein